MNVPSEKKCILDTDIITDTCGYGIYPQLYNIKKHSSGIIQVFHNKMSINAAPYLLPKSTNLALNMVLFYADFAHKIRVNNILSKLFCIPETLKNLSSTIK